VQDEIEDEIKPRKRCFETIKVGDTEFIKIKEVYLDGTIINIR
jgi:hypothetical protein